MEILIYILAWVALSLVGIGALVARDNLKYKLDDAHKRIDRNNRAINAILDYFKLDIDQEERYNVFKK